MLVIGNGANKASQYRQPVKSKCNSNFPVGSNWGTREKKELKVSPGLAFVGKKIREATEKPLELIYMADTHKRLEMMPKIKTVIDKYQGKKSDGLVIHAGDFGMGSEGLGKQVELLNKLGVNLTTLGNHEFYSGSETLALELGKSEFQTVISNLEVPKTNPVSNLFDKGKLVKSTIKEINGKKYAFIGAVTAGINNEAYNKFTQGMKATMPLEAIRSEVKSLEAQGINRIILVSHLGYNYDKDVAQKVPGIDVIVGGHSHIALPGIENGVNLFNSAGRNEPVLILHAGAYGEAVGVSHLIFNEKGILQVKPQKAHIKIKSLARILDWLTSSNKIKQSTNFLVEVAGYKDNKDIAKIVKTEKAHMVKITDLKESLNGDWPAAGPSEVGCLTADAIRDLTGAQVAIIQPGAIRHSIPAGELYEEDIKNQILPYTTPIIKVKLTGKDLLKTLNVGAKCAGKAQKPGLIQVSGLKYKVDMDRNINARVSQVLINTGTVYEPIDLNKEYTVAYDMFLLDGGDQIAPLKNGKLVESYLSDTYATALIKYIKKLSQNNQPIKKDFSDRIIVDNQSDNKGFLPGLLNVMGIRTSTRVDHFVLKD